MVVVCDEEGGSYTDDLREATTEHDAASGRLSSMEA